MKEKGIQYIYIGLGLNQQRPHLQHFIYDKVSTQLELIGWGNKPSGKLAKRLARNFKALVLILEDGFIRSYGTGECFPPLSLVLDKTGIYYDAAQPSDLENLLNSSDDLFGVDTAHILTAKNFMLEHQLSKYNHAPLFDASKLSAHQSQPKILVVDQTVGDMSIRYGMANASTFEQMLDAALQEYPTAQIYIKTHPEVSARRKRGYLSHIAHERVTILRDAMNPQSLMVHMDHVYVVTSHMGFEALLLNKPVSVFGLPWYAGWGLTNDRQRCLRRTRIRNVDELFAAAYWHYARYLNPWTHESGTVMDVMQWLVLQRRMVAQFTGKIVVVGFRRWKIMNMRAMLSLNSEKLHFVSSVRQAALLNLTAEDHLICWGRNASTELTKLVNQTQAKLLHLEDGFLRSVGLGSDLLPPQSFVLDGQGIYFDATQPSDLECILNEHDFSEAELLRAALLRQSINEHHITKYNVEPTGVPSWAEQETIILVVGQVEDDASIRYGCADIRTNLALIQAARAQNPTAFIVYKPHPDVQSGNRRGRLHQQQVMQYVDYVENQISVISCIESCHKVYTLTSLAGFDALLRGKEVVVLGRPFYAGWGLTQDQLLIPRRERKLTLDALVAGVLVLYPCYWDPVLKGFTVPEVTVRQLADARNTLMKQNKSGYLQWRWLRRQFYKLRLLLRAYLLPRQWR